MQDIWCSSLPRELRFVADQSFSQAKGHSGSSRLPVNQRIGKLLALRLHARSLLDLTCGCAQLVLRTQCRALALWPPPIRMLLLSGQLQAGIKAPGFGSGSWETPSGGANTWEMGDHSPSRTTTLRAKPTAGRAPPRTPQSRQRPGAQDKASSGVRLDQRSRLVLSDAPSSVAGPGPSRPRPEEVADCVCLGWSVAVPAHLRSRAVSG